MHRPTTRPETWNGPTTGHAGFRARGDWSLADIDLWAIFPTGRPASAKARAFADFIGNRLRGASAACRRGESAEARRLDDVTGDVQIQAEK